MDKFLQGKKKKKEKKNKEGKIKERKKEKRKNEVVVLVNRDEKSSSRISQLVYKIGMGFEEWDGI